MSGHTSAVGSAAALSSGSVHERAPKSLSRAEKWRWLSPHLRLHGKEALAYATLQEGLEYYQDEFGYIAFTSVSHPVFARKVKRIALSDPICAPENFEKIVRNFLAENPRASFAVISEQFAQVLRPMGFKINCLGFEPEIPIQTYNTKGNWKELDLIKRARNEARREGIVIREEDHIDRLDRAQLNAINTRWIGTKRVSDREIWIYARRALFEPEEEVRKFVAYDKEGRVAGFVFYDPMYQAGAAMGYAASIVRCDEQRFGRLATAIHMEAVEKFKAEGKQLLNLLLAPFAKLNAGKYNDDVATKWFFKASERFGDKIYNFQGLAFHKSKYRCPEKSLYWASNSAMPANDIYLAFLSADITRSYFSTLGRLVWGMLTAVTGR